MSDLGVKPEDLQAIDKLLRAAIKNISLGYYGVASTQVGDADTRIKMVCKLKRDEHDREKDANVVDSPES